MPGQTADDTNRTVRNGNNNCAQYSVPENGYDTKSDVNLGPVGRAKSKFKTTEAGMEIDSLGVDYAKCDEIPVTKMIPVDNNRRNMTVCCFGLCGITDRLNRPELDWCWDCVDRLVWGYCVSCVVTIVTKTRSLGIDLFTEGRCVYTSTLGFVDDHVRAYDVIPVYVWMKENFKSGLNKVMLMKKAPVDSRYHQRGGDNRQVRKTRASVDNRPIRVWGRFGCLYSPVRGADWSDVLSVGGGPVGKDVWIGYIGDGFLQCQSPDAAPLTELRDLNTLLHIYSDCTTRLYLIWTVCITVRISISIE